MARWARGALLVAIIGGLALRSYRLAERSMWFDEAVSYTLVSQFSYSEMIDRIGRAVHPPLYFILLRQWTACFGTSLAAMRSLSVVLAGATIVGVYFFCRDALRDDATQARESRVVGALAATLLAASSVQIAWAQQARMYTLGTALVVFSTWLLVRALRGGHRPGWWIGYALTAAGLMYTHNYGLFSVAAQGCFVYGYFFWQYYKGSSPPWRSNSFWWAFLSMATALALYLPWLPVLLSQTRRVHEDYWIAPLRAWTVPNAWFDLFWPNEYASPNRIAVVGLAAALVIVMGAMAARSRPGRWLVLAMIVVPVVGALALSIGVAPIIVPRYFLFAHVFMVCAIADVVWRALPGNIRPLAVSFLLVTCLTVHWCYWDELQIARRPGLRGAVEYVLGNRQSEEPLIVVHPAIYHSVKYYTRGVAHPKLFLPSGLSHYNGGPLLLPGDTIGPADLEKQDGERIWVLDTNGFIGTFSRFELPTSWQPVPGTSDEFPEVHYFQNKVIATLYEKVPESG